MDDMGKSKYMIAGVPTSVPPEKIYTMEGPLMKRAHTYFGKEYGKEGFNQYVACYIDNYLSLEKLVSGEEERREMAWSLVKGSHTLRDDQRPDKKFENQYRNKIIPVIKSKVNTLLDNHENGWCFMRLLMNIEPAEEWTSHRFYEEVILKYGIDNVRNSKETHRQLVARINLFDFIDKYLSKKYNITLEEFDI